MTMIVHRNVAKKHFCPGCDHFHQIQQPGMPPGSGVCLLYPPTPFIVGMATPAIAPVAKEQIPSIPITRAYYPPVTAVDTCAQWTPRAKGEA